MKTKEFKVLQTDEERKRWDKREVEDVRQEQLRGAAV